MKEQYQRLIQRLKQKLLTHTQAKICGTCGQGIENCVCVSHSQKSNNKKEIPPSSESPPLKENTDSKKEHQQVKDENDFSKVVEFLSQAPFSISKEEAGKKANELELALAIDKMNFLHRTQRPILNPDGFIRSKSTFNGGKCVIGTNGCSFFLTQS